MRGIFGFFSRNEAPVSESTLRVLSAGMEGWGGCEIWRNGFAALGCAGVPSVSAAHDDSPSPWMDRVVFASAGRVDNVEDLRRRLSISSQERSISDGELIRRAYVRWGEDCVKRIYGDWSFAVFHPAARRLFLARDHFGSTSLYYYFDDRVFAFASEPKALLALKLAPPEMDELYLAQVLISWPAFHGGRTIRKRIYRLPPAHTVTVTPGQLTVREYWRPEDTPVLRLPRRKDYIPAFREVFDEAVRARLRRTPSKGTGTGEKGGIAVALSGGLDSGAVTATAARLLQPESGRLIAFTAVPIWDTKSYFIEGFGNEYPLARATAQFAGNVDHVAVTASSVTPIQAVRRMLEIHDEPSHGAGNFYWIYNLHETASKLGCGVLLTGQAGNAGISWPGNVYSQPLLFQIARNGYGAWLRGRIRQILPLSLMKALRRHRMSADWYRDTSINPDFARRLHLLERRLDDPLESPRGPLEQRCRILRPGCSVMGASNAQTGAAHGLEIRDPTADARVLAFTFSVPDEVFMEPETRLDRWVIREAMRDRLPEVVRLNRRRGRQAGDLVPRLRACADEVNAALDELARGAAADYLDIPYMRMVWGLVQTQDTPEAYHKSVTVLTRGIMAGLCVNGFHSPVRSEAAQ